MSKKTRCTGICAFTVLILFLFSRHAFARQEVTDASNSREVFTKLLTAEEQEYLNTEQTLSVIVSARKGPIQYEDATGQQKGISKDLLDEISALSGLKFVYITMDGMQNIRDAIDSGNAQIISGIPPEVTVQTAYDVSFSKSYLECSYGIALERGRSLSEMEHLTLALTAGLDIPDAFEDVKEIKYYPSIPDCLNAVNRGEADFTYGNSYVLEFYSQGYALQSLCVIPLNGSSQTICFGVSHMAGKPLIGILDKALDYLGSDKILDIVIANVAASTQPVTLASLISSNPGLSLLCGLLLLILILTIAVLVIRIYRHKNKLALIEHQRYLMVSAAAKDYFFEYHCRNDTLTLSGDMAELFGCRNVLHKWNGQLQKNTVSQGINSEVFHRMLEPCPSQEQAEQKEYRELKLITKTGQEHWFRVTKLTIFERGKPSCVIGKLTDIQADYEEREHLMRKSLSDSLTGLYNAAAVRDLVGRFVQQRKGSFFMIDLDCFKSVNDQCGHQKGDEVLIAFANILKTVFRSDDIIGRIGGDEFAVFAKDATEDSFIANKCQLLKEMAAQLPVMDHYIQTISIGIAKAESQSDFDILYHDADAALYLVKKKSKDGYQIFS